MKKKILLVDDEEIILYALGADLTDHDFDVTTANTAKKALTKLKKNHFELLITDLSMKNMTGLELIEKVKKIAPEMSIIILTGYGALDSAVEALRLGADDYLIKPCNLEEMLLRITNCMEKQELRQKIKLYENILPVCCMCKKIHDDSSGKSDQESWLEYKEYITTKTGIQFTHGFCPECHAKSVDEWEKR